MFKQLLGSQKDDSFITIADPLREEASYNNLLCQIDEYPEGFLASSNSTIPGVVVVSANDLTSKEDLSIDWILKYDEGDLEREKYYRFQNNWFIRISTYPSILKQWYDQYGEKHYYLGEKHSPNGYVISDFSKLNYIYNVKTSSLSTAVSDIQIIDFIYDCEIENYYFKKPINVYIEYEEDYYICYENLTNMYGTGNDIVEAKKDYCDALIYHFNFLKQNKDSLIKDDFKKLEYLENIIEER